MIKEVAKSLFYSLPHDTRRVLLSILAPEKTREYSRLRTEGISGYRLKEAEELGLLFIHVPKTGGSSINEALFGTKGAGHLAYYFMELIYSKKELDEMFTFGFVRNPWSRLYSSFRYLSKGGGSAADEIWADGIGIVSMDFEEFVIDHLHRPEVMGYIHFVPQHVYLLNGRGNLTIDFIGRYEQLSSDFEKVVAHCGLETDLPHLNSSGDSVDFRQAYTPGMISKVSKFYKKDIDLFDYSFE